MSNSHGILLAEPIEGLLLLDRDLHTSVHKTLDVFGQWLEASDMPFFSEYTEHGLAHVTSIIETAWLLLNDHAQADLKPVDAAILSLAALLHDAAMHLSEDGFLALLKEEELATPLPGFKEQDWRMLWQDFSAEAVRWDERQLLDVFGQSEPITSFSLDPLDMTKKERLAIGVFLRRYHHRLAHEIALRGVPGPSKQRLTLASVPSAIRDLAGFVARSHGQALRISCDYIRKRHHAVKVPCIGLLMASLRIADFLDVRPGRAPPHLTLTRRLLSPISVQEHRVNQCISKVSLDNQDPCAIVVLADPPDAQTYMRVRQWLDGLQTEMDAAGLVLTETPEQETTHVGLRFLRVKSNLDDLKAFARTVNYIPAEIRLTIAENDLIRLLIKDLYGDAPEIGIRELVQNSVDAVRELRSLEERGKGTSKLPKAEHRNFDVIVSLEQDDSRRRWIVVDDCGIGMSFQTVVDYFLRVGATFRRSSEWRLQFEPVVGCPAVVRSGRFGIGVLAAFLLGPKVCVSTRHAMAQVDEGLEFEVGVDSEVIEVRRISREAGTTVRIEISYSTWLHLHKNTDLWDWYHQSNPSLGQQIIEEGEVQEQETAFLLPQFGEPLPLHWHRVSTDEFPEIDWTFMNGPAAINCNGIDISLPSYNSHLKGLTVGHPAMFLAMGVRPRPLFSNVQIPKLSISDPHGKLPLNLERTGLTTSTLPFKKALFDDVMRNIVACLVVSAPLAPPNGSKAFSLYSYLIPFDYPTIPRFSTHTDLRSEHASWWPWFFTEDGAGPTTYWNITHANIKNALLICLKKESRFKYFALPSNLSNLADAVFVFYVQGKKTYMTRWLRFALLDKGYGNNPFDRLKISSARVLIPERIANEVRDSQRFPKRLRTKLNEVRISDQHLLWDAGNADHCQVKFGEVAKGLRSQFGSSVIAIAEWRLKSVQPRSLLTPFEKEWSDAMDNAIVPFNASERKALIDAVRSQLASHIDSHEELAKQWQKWQRSKSRSKARG